MMDEALDEYRKMFDEPFPLMLVMGMGENEIIKIIQKCIESGDPYDPDIPNDAVI